jgi:hypothetical protein
VAEVEQHTAVNFLEAKDANGASRVAVFDTGVTFGKLET